MNGTVQQISYKQASDFLMPRHYSGRVPSISKAFGWYWGGQLKAVVTFGKPSSPSPCRGICGDEWSKNVMELNRLCRQEDFDKPLSQFVGSCLRKLKALDWIVVSYSDTQMHHNGYIYQACNFIYTGQTKQRTDMYVGPGKHSRHYTQSDLQSNIRAIRSAKNRYVYFCTNSKRMKAEWQRCLKYPILPYPKEQNQNYTLGQYIKPQLVDKRTGELINDEKVVQHISTWVYDFEVTAHDWLVCAKLAGRDEWFVVHNDTGTVKEWIREQNPLLCGFNSKHYDDYIMKGVLIDSTPEQIKAINDWIIVEGNDGWRFPAFALQKPMWFASFDLMDDMQAGQSLKSIEGHLGMDIRESGVSFDIDREWTADELQEMIEYCKADVVATEKLMQLRKGYLNAKVDIGKMVGIPERDALRMTNAKLTAAFLGAVKHEYDDERKYTIPGNLKTEYIPKEVIDYFMRMYDERISDEDLYGGGKLDIMIGECPVTIGWGGIHGAKPNYMWQEGKDDSSQT